jgi:hypothetical protein
MFLILAYSQLSEIWIVIIITEIKLKNKIQNLSK